MCSRFLLIASIQLSLFAPGMMAAKAEPIDKDAIIEQLNRNVKAKKVDVDELRNSVKNKIEIEAKQPARTVHVPNLAQELPSISFEIYFDYNSTVIKQESVPTLVRLGQALSDSRLEKFRFLVAGHTDSVGGREFNRQLSERRADAVRTFLVASFRIPPERVMPVGFGKEQLKDAANPFSGVNRRVEIINLGP